MKKIFVGAVLSAIVVFSLAANGKKEGGTPGTDPVTGEKYPSVVNIGTLYGASETALQIAKGYWEKLGVPVKVLYFESGRDVNTAFASKSIVAATFGSSPISLGIANDLGYEVVYFNNVIGTGEALAVRNASNIKSFADLRGKKIAAPFASTSHYSLLKALEIAGIPQNSLALLDMQPQDILAAWIRGDIDGAYVWSPELDELLKTGHLLTDSGRLAEQGGVTADLTVVNSEFAKKYPGFVEKYVASFVEAYRLINADPKGSITLMAKQLELDEAETKKLVEGFIDVPPEDQLTARYLGKTGSLGELVTTLKSTADFHVTQHNLSASGPLSKYQAAVNPSFLEAVLK